MKCPLTGEVCLKSKSFQVTEIKNNKYECFNICDDCFYNLDKQKEILQNVCPFCNISLEELVENSRIGCAKCYEIFEEPIKIALERIQDNPDNQQEEIHHVGKVPNTWKKKTAAETDHNKFLLKIKQKLAICIKDENYELANQLKYMIKGFEALIEKLKEFENDLEQKELIKNQISEFIYLFNEKNNSEI